MNFPEKVLLIHEEYDTVLNTFQDWSQKGGGGIVVTGQPGIVSSKTVFLFYVLFHYLSQGLPTTFQMFDDRFFLFTEAGTSKHNVVAESAMEIPSGTWTLTNSSDFVRQPCSVFLAAW
ncbi:hypothetical protein AX15_007371 [Amanita polypyramis BW_CC]|nr:hypothetical protein AX15_007371 [Amanita polypyramis BW_CC]